MFENFYQFETDPFRLTPDNRFGYIHPSYAKARGYMRYALERAEGFLMITGEPGTGKTQLISDMLSKLDESRIQVTHLAGNKLGAEDVLRLLAMDYGIDALSTDKGSLLHEIKNHLLQLNAEGRRAILVLDEAQSFERRALEELRMLSNLQTDGQSLIQIFFIGQEELRQTVYAPDMEQLRQRIIATCRLEPLNEEETRDYIESRLTIAGWKDNPSFEAEMFPLIKYYTNGVPRRINRFMDRLLLLGSMEEKTQLGTDEVWQVVEELYGERLLPQAANQSLDDLWDDFQAMLAPLKPESVPEPVDEIASYQHPDNTFEPASIDEPDIPVLPVSPAPEIDTESPSLPPKAAPPAPAEEPEPLKAGTAPSAKAAKKTEPGGSSPLRWLGYAAGLALIAAAITLPMLEDKSDSPAFSPNDAVTEELNRPDTLPTQKTEAPIDAEPERETTGQLEKTVTSLPEKTAPSITSSEAVRPAIETVVQSTPATETAESTQPAELQDSTDQVPLVAVQEKQDSTVSINTAGPENINNTERTAKNKSREKAPIELPVESFKEDIQTDTVQEAASKGASLTEENTETVNTTVAAAEPIEEVNSTPQATDDDLEVNLPDEKADAAESLQQTEEEKVALKSTEEPQKEVIPPEPKPEVVKRAPAVAPRTAPVVKSETRLDTNKPLPQKEPVVVAKSEPVKKQLSPAEELKKTLLTSQWTSNGKPATLLPSSLNNCRDRGQQISCTGRRQTTTTKHGEVLYQVVATMDTFTSRGVFQVSYQTKVALLKPEDNPENDDFEPSWQISNHKTVCTLENGTVVRCSNDKGKTRVYQRTE